MVLGTVNCSISPFHHIWLKCSGNRLCSSVGKQNITKHIPKKCQIYFDSILSITGKLQLKNGELNGQSEIIHKDGTKMKAIIHHGQITGI